MRVEISYSLALLGSSLSLLGHVSAVNRLLAHPGSLASKPIQNTVSTISSALRQSQSTTAPQTFASLSPEAQNDIKADCDDPALYDLRARYYVDGKTIPLISKDLGDVGPSYAGSVNVSKDGDKGSLFFWYPGYNKSSTYKGSENDFILWFNGGPGCSSLLGATQEVGPFNLTTPVDTNISTAMHTPYAWNQLASMAFFEAPIGVGFTRGKPPTIHDETEFAEQFYGAFESFLEIFPEVRKKRIFLVGESYGAMYVTYAAARLLEGELNVKGVGIVDGLITDDRWQSSLTVMPFVREHMDIFLRPEWKLNESFIGALENKAKEAGLTDEFWAEAYATPLKGPILMPKKAEKLELWDDVLKPIPDEACFNPYWIIDECGDANVTSPLKLLDQTDFKEAFHAPVDNIHWSLCSQFSVFIDDTDTSPPLASTPFFGDVITKVTQEQKGRFLVMHGGLDMVLIANGTLLGLLNTTWGGEQGFSTPFVEPFMVDGQRAGTAKAERGLTFAKVDSCGHECPAYNPPAAFKLVQWLLGHIEDEDLHK